MAEKDRLLSVRQAGEWLGLTPLTIYKWIWAGRLLAKRLPNGALRIEREELEKLLSEDKRATDADPRK